MDAPPTDDEPGAVDAGDFSRWWQDVRVAVGARTAMDVPCGACTACCRSSQFVHIEPDETDTLAHVPPALRFPAPGLPPGHQVMGYDEHGCCPMLGPDGCTIYEHRPRTCRAYDCRVFAATGVLPDDHQPLIRQRVARWRFRYDDERGRSDHARAQRAAAELARAAGHLPRDLAPRTQTQLAVLALRLAAMRPDDGPAGARVEGDGGASDDGDGDAVDLVAMLERLRRDGAEGRPG